MSPPLVSLRERLAAPDSSPTPVKLLALAAVVSALMFYRRPDQFRHPYVWVEDGTINLPQFADLGWAFVLQPIVGYLSIPLRAVFGLSAWLSFRWLPEISFVLTLLFVYAVIVAIALSPTTLRHRFWCAVMVMLVPSYSEVFGVSLYLGWWGSLLAILPIFWRESPRLRLRSVLLTVGGLSTPIVIGLLPLYVWRLHRFRRRPELWMALLCAVLAAAQATFLLRNANPIHGNVGWTFLPSIVEKFFGNYVIWTSLAPGSHNYLVPGLAVCTLVAVSLYVRRPVGWNLMALTACLVMTIALSVGRQPADVMHPVLAGGRYFFLPNVMLSWLFLNLLERNHRATTVLALGALVMSVGMAAAYGQRTHRAIDWRAEVETCLDASTHAFPIHFEGDAWHGIIWSVTLTRDQCARLVQESVFDDSVAAR